MALVREGPEVPALCWEHKSHLHLVDSMPQAPISKNEVRTEGQRDVNSMGSLPRSSCSYPLFKDVNHNIRGCAGAHLCRRGLSTLAQPHPGPDPHPANTGPHRRKSMSTV